MLGFSMAVRIKENKAHEAASTVKQNIAGPKIQVVVDYS